MKPFCVLVFCVLCFGFATEANSQCDKGVCPLPPVISYGVIVKTPVCVVAVKTPACPVVAKAKGVLKKLVRPVKTIRESRKVRGPWKTRCGRRGPARLLRRIINWRPLQRLRK